MLNKLYLKSLFLMLCMMLGTTAWADEVTFDASVDITANATSYQTTEATFTASDGSVWKANGYGATANTCIVIGKGGANYLETPEVNGKITSIAVTWSGNASYYLALQTITGTELEAKKNPSEASTETFTVSTGDYNKLRLVGRRNSGTSNAAATITKVVVTYTPNASNLLPNDLSLSDTILTLDLNNNTSVQLTNSGSANGAITWYSDNTDVATVDAQGNITAVEVGTCTITATQAASTTYYGGSATCDVTVTDSRYLLASLEFTAKCNGTGTDTGGFGWTISSDAAESTYDQVSGIHYGTNNANVTYVQLSSSANNGTIKKVLVNARDAQECATLTVTVGGIDFTCSTSPNVTNLSSNFVFTGNAKGEIIVRVDRGTSKSKAIYVKKVDVYYEESTLLNPELSFDGTSFMAVVGDDFTPPTLNNPHNLAISYQSSDTDIVTVDNAGNVTLVGPGTATITATSQATSTYDAGSVFYTIKVIEVEDGVFDFTSGFDYYSSMEHGSVAYNNYNWEAGNVIMYLDGRNCWFTDNTLRLYSEHTSGGSTTPAGTMTFEVPDGKAITEIVFTGNSGKLDSLTVDSGIYTAEGATATWEGMAQTVTFTACDAVVIKTAVVSYVEATGVLTPTFSVAEGLYTSQQKVEIRCATEGASIYYTTDGTAPTDQSTLYTDSIPVFETTTIKAIAYKDGENSAIASVTLTFRKAANIAELKTFESKTEDIILTLNNVQVFYVNNKDMYVGDATGALDMYNLGLNYTAGQILNGTAIVKYEVYNNATPEITSFEPVGELTVTDGTPTPVEVSGSAVTLEDNVCQFVKVTGPYTVDETSTTATYIDGLLCYNKFGIEEPAYDTSKLYVATGIVIPYRGAPELALISVEEVPSVVPGDVDGQDGVTLTDLQLLVQYLLGKNPDGVVNPDVDGSGTVSLSDITTLVNILNDPTAAH